MKQGAERSLALRVMKEGAQRSVGAAGRLLHLNRPQKDETSSQGSGSTLEFAQADVTPLETLFEFDCGFLNASLRAIEERPGLELRITAYDAPLTDEGLSKLFDFAESVLVAEEASPGFIICCDLRRLRVPKMSMVSACSKWSNDPVRRKAFQSRCLGGKICVPSGLKFRLAKAALTVFFQQCPLSGPACLVTSLDGSDGPMVTFGPTSNTASRNARTGNGSVCNAAAGEHLKVAPGHSILSNFEAKDSTLAGFFDALGHLVASACGGCFDFVSPLATEGGRREREAQELEELKRTIEVLSTRIAELENQKRVK